MSATAGFLDSALFDPTSEPEPEQPIFKGLIYRGDVVPWIGREKHRKSNLVLQCAICAALGRPFLNFTHGTGNPMRVVIVDYESKEQPFQRRYAAVCGAMNLGTEERRTLGQHLKVVLVRKLRRQRQPVPRFPVKTHSSPDKEADTWWKRLAAEYPADLYVFDPMRCLHGQDENDSTLESLLSRLREVFPDAALIIPHHMTKSSATTKDSKDGLFPPTISLSNSGHLRTFANGARGSSAINAHADCVICQERRVECDIETVYLGAYMKDAPDVEPLPLVESDHESFFWITSEKMPEHLRGSFESLRRAGRTFKSKSDAALALQTREDGQSSVSRATAFSHVKQLTDGGFLEAAPGGTIIVRHFDDENCKTTGHIGGTK